MSPQGRPSIHATIAGLIALLIIFSSRDGVELYVYEQLITWYKPLNLREERNAITVLFCMSQSHKQIIMLWL